MVRTKADSGSAASRKVVAASAPRKVLGSSGSSGSSGESPSGKGKYAGGNPVCPRPTPEWQKGIGMFLKKSPSKSTEKENSDPTELDQEKGASSSSGAGSSGSNADEIEVDNEDS
ncbi:PCNA-associated factor-like [Argopecten irradians]|uniref:PCNA-associated factor-like n=1 Tax=Argopecten irradians TaxID=31199 RepID=UPI00371013A6